MTTLGFVLLIITWVIVGLATKDRKHTPQTIYNPQNETFRKNKTKRCVS